MSSSSSELADRLDDVVEILNAGGTGWDVLSSSDDLTKVTLFDGTFYLDITITKWEEKDA